MIAASAMLSLLVILPTIARAQSLSSGESSKESDNYWKRFAIGAGASLLAHESAHILTALALGFHPHIGFDKGRPTVYSGIDSEKYPHKQFLFSAAGLTTQALINELILDVPHSRGGAIERGVLACGIGTTLFYISIGRNGDVSDIAFMARTSSLSKTQLSLIYGGVSAVHAVRMWRDPAYSHFFIRPTGNGAALGFSF
ncbi:MAG TPA: hypothetical protein VK481_08410 [Gemmatimonadaceae bacterium]|nr:hypothetical protein [Gemmatimonadaceae bacterium]